MQYCGTVIVDTVVIQKLEGLSTEVKGRLGTDSYAQPQISGHGQARPLVALLYIQDESYERC